MPIYNVAPTYGNTNVALISISLQSGTDNTAAYNAALAASAAAMPTYETTSGGAPVQTTAEGMSLETNPQTAHRNSVRLPNNCQAYIANTTANAPDGVLVEGNHSNVFVPLGQTAIRSINTNANGRSGGSDVTITDLKIKGIGQITDSAVAVPLAYFGGGDRLTLRDVTFATGLTGSLLGGYEYFDFDNVAWTYNRVGKEFANGPSTNYDGTNDGSGYPSTTANVTIDATCLNCSERKNYVNTWYNGAAGIDEFGGTGSYASVIPYIFGDSHPDWISSITSTGTVGCPANSSTNLTITDSNGGKGAEFRYTCSAAGNGGTITKIYAGRGYKASTTTIAAATPGFFSTTPTLTPLVRSMSTWGSHQGASSKYPTSQILIQGKNIEVLSGNDINLAAYMGANSTQIDFPYNQFADDASMPHLALADGTTNKFKDNWGMNTAVNAYTGLSCPLLAGRDGAYVTHAPEADEPNVAACDTFTTPNAPTGLNPSVAGGETYGQNVASLLSTPLFLQRS